MIFKEWVPARGLAVYGPVAWLLWQGRLNLYPYRSR